MSWRLPEAVDLLGVSTESTTTDATHASQIVQGVEFGRQSTMNTQELLVHDGSEGE